MNTMEIVATLPEASTQKLCKPKSISYCLLYCTQTIVFVLALVLCICFSLLLGLPYPQIHDEYSYCLAGETFASGRLTNPTHPMAEHFETMHVLQHPTYMSKYPPGQGIVLAIGHWLGHPMFGVWLSFALACAAMSWAMSAVVDNIWAVVCSVLFAFSMNCVSYMFQIGYWAHSYWGGSVACLGSALAFGSVLWFGREVDGAYRPMSGDAREQSRSEPATGASSRRLMWLLTLFVIGLWLMAISRPLEGLLVSIPMSIAMLMLWLKSARFVPVFWTLKRLALPLLVGLIGMIWLGYYNARITGSPFQLPYLCYEQQYALTPMFLKQPLRESPIFNNEPMRSFHEDWEVGIFRSMQTATGYLAKKQSDLAMLWTFFLGRSLSIPVLIGCVVSAAGLFSASILRRANLVELVGDPNLVSQGSLTRSTTQGLNSRECFRLASVGGSAVGLIMLVHSQTAWMNAHYMAPLVPILWCWIALGLASTASWKIRRLEVGLFLAIACMGFAAMERYDEFDFSNSRIANFEQWHHQRQNIESQLRSSDGLHLVLVEYAPSHSPHQEWCYNSADIDRSKIVWARDLGPVKNQAVLHYFSKRTLHRLAIDFGPVKLETVDRLDASGKSE